MAQAFPYPTRARVEKVFATAHPDSDPEGIVSRYLEFELSRFRLEDAFACRGSLSERLKALHWFLSGYGAHRGLPLPLSQAQIDFLNAPAPVLGLGAELSIGAYSFITAEFRPAGDLANEAVLRECLYWWACERAIQFAPGGELVTPAQVRALAHVGPEDAGKRFPLNYFVRRTHELDPTLHGLDPDIATDRALLVAIMMLRCARHPFMTRMLPRACVAALLATRDQGRPSDWDELLAIACAGDAAAAAPDFRRLLENRLSAQGYAFHRSDRRAQDRPRHAGLCHARDPAIGSGIEAGIAVIGPTRAASGLGQATRLSIDVLQEAGRAPAVFDFGLDNPAPTGFASQVRAPRLRVPRQINLLHLNAESIPLAVAYIDSRLYERSYNIGYFFWELDKIPSCQRLALDLLDEIWVSSEYNRAIYAAATDIPVRNVGMAVEPLPEASPVSRQQLGIEDDAFVFLATFDSFSFVERKNPLGVLAAFQAAFPPDAGDKVELILKTQNRTRVGDPHQVRVWKRIDAIVQADPRIRILDQTLGYRELLGFKRACDCYVSLHRSEGWGFGLIEAMQLRLPVIATGYSGSMEFCSDETAFLVDYELVAPTPAEYIFVERGSRWAEPCTGSAARAMRAVFADPARAQERAEAAYRRVCRDFSVGAIAARYGARLAEIDTLIARSERDAA